MQLHRCWSLVVSNNTEMSLSLNIHWRGLMRRANWLLLLSAVWGAFNLISCERHTVKSEPPLVLIDMHSMGVPGQQQFREVLSKNDLPIEVVGWFTGGIADPGEKYFETDVGDSHLPRRRLLVAGKSPKYCIVNYEVGGLAHGYIIR